MALATRSLELDWPLVEELIGRPLRRAEQAIDVVRLDQALEQAKDDLEAAIRDEMLAATAAWKGGGAIRPALRVTQEMLDVLDRLREIGREEAELELERAGYVGIRRRSYIDEAPAGRDVEGYLRQNLGSVTTRIEDELVTTELAGASQAAIAQALLKVPGARDIASRVISTALIDGLSETWDRNADLVACWEYTAVLDSGTCHRCAPLDGKRYSSLELLFRDLPNFGPNPLCLGGGRCRCRAVPCPTDEAPQNAPEPEPIEELDPSLPGWRREIAEIRTRLQPLDVFGKFGERAPAVDDLVASGLVRRSGLPFPHESDIVPGDAMAALETDVMRAGALIDAELDARIGLELGELDVKARRLDEVVAAKSDVYAAAREVYSQAREAYHAELRATQAVVRQELIAARGVEATPWQVTGADVQADARVQAIIAEQGPRIEELQKAQSEALGQAAIARANVADVRAEIAQKSRDTLVEILEEHRGLGSAGEQAWTFSTKGARGAAKQILEEAAAFFPRDWIIRGRLNPIKPRFTKNGRGYHRGGSTESDLVVSGGDRSKIKTDPDGFATAIHELGHHLEHVDPRIRALEWAFYQRRTRAAGYGIQEREFAFPRGSGYGRHETYRKDGFLESYMGKTYGNGPRSSYEVFTMGLESIWTGSYELDQEMREFILGLLATL